MADELIFWMGKFEARFPTDLAYARNHMWAREVEEGGKPHGPTDVGMAPSEGMPHDHDGEELYRFGFSAYAVRLLQDVYFLDWTVDAPVDLQERQEIGAIESSKAESALYAPMTGRLVEFNRELLSDPSLINSDKYGRGWLFTMRGTGHGLLTPAQYLDHLASAWKLAERTIKGQMNE